MKYSLWCYLSGNKWLVRDYAGYTDDSGRYRVRPTDWCARCGLSKKEAGIV